MPGPKAFAVQLIVTDGPVTTPPAGARRVTVGWARSRDVADTPTSQRSALSRTWARTVLFVRRSVAFVSTLENSKAEYSRREGIPPQAPTPAVPLFAEETHRRPMSVAPPQPLTPPSSHATLDVPPPPDAAISSSAPPVRCGVYATPPVYAPLTGSPPVPITCVMDVGSHTKEAFRTPWSHAAFVALYQGEFVLPKDHEVS